MKRFFLIALSAFVTLSAFANGDDWVRQSQKEKPKKEKIDQQKMEAPASSSVGGANSGKMLKEQNQEQQIRQDLENQKLLYEYKGKYRKGL
jgi:hypothetical protein